MRISKYNKKASMKANKLRMQREKQYIKSFNKIYNQIMDDIENEIYKYATKYAQENEISIGQARQLINVNIDGNPYKITRLQLLQNNIFDAFTQNMIQENTKAKNHFYNEMLETMDDLKTLLNMNVPTAKRIMMQFDSIINAEYKGLTFDDRLWKNQQGLKNVLDNTIYKSVIVGKNPKTWASDLIKEINKDVGNYRYISNRLAITETTRVVTDVQVKSFVESGFDAYIFNPLPNACEKCIPLKNKIIPIDKAVQGVNKPPMHPFCKCAISGYKLEWAKEDGETHLIY